MSVRQPDAQESWNGPADSAETGPDRDPIASRVPDPGHAPATHVRFEERDALGSGGGGRVVRGVDRWLDRDVALKIVGPERPLALARLRREAAILVALEHPGIVPLYDLVERPDGGLQLALRIVRGASLAHALVAASPPDKARTIGHLRHLARSAHAVAWAHHKGFVHRDLKPANIMVGEFGETQVIDWGLAVHPRVTPDSLAVDAANDADDLHPPGFDPGLTHAGAVVGTPRYMSPEQARGERVDARADVWSLGVILFEILTGAPAFPDTDTARVLDAVRRGVVPDPRSRAPTVPAELAAIIAKATAALERRYPDARAFADDLDAWLDGRPVAAHRYAVAQRIGRFVRKRRMPIALGAGALATALALALAPRPDPQLIEDTARSAALTADLAQRERDLAASIATEAEDLLAEGKTPEAALAAARSMLLAPNPTARGVLTLTLGADGPRLAASTPLGAERCLTASIHPDGERWLCRRDADVALYRRGELVWRRAGRADGAAFVAGGARIAVVAADQRVVSLATDTGAEVSRSEPLRCGSSLLPGPASELAILHGRLCFVLLDGERAHRVMDGTAIQAAALGADDRWAIVTFEGALLIGALDLGPERGEPAGPERPVPTDLGDLVMDISAMALVDDGIILGTLRGELVRVGLDGRMTARRMLQADVPVTSIATSPSGLTLAVTLDRGGPLIVASDGLQVRARLPEIDAGALLIGDDGHAITVARRYARWDLGRRVRAFRGLVGLTSIATDGRLLAVAHDRRVTTFDVRDGRVAARLTTEEIVKSIAIHPRGDELVTSELEATTIARHDASLAPLPSASSSIVRRLVYSADGTLVALPYKPFMWIATPDAPTEAIVYGAEELTDVAVHHQRAAVLSRGHDAILLGLDPAPVELARCPVPGAIAISLLPAGDALVVAHPDGVMLVDPYDCGLVDWRAAHLGTRALRLTDVQVSADGAWIAAAAREGQVLVWHGSTLVVSVRAHAQRVAQLAFDPRAPRLYSAGWDGAVRTLDLDVLAREPATLMHDVRASWGL